MNTDSVSTDSAPDWTLELFVPGRPAPQGSKRHVGRGILLEQSKALAPWRTFVAWSVSQAWAAPPIQGPVTLRLSFVLHRPASCPKRSTPPAIKKNGDVDKLTRAVMDALTTAGVYLDDAQVIDQHSTKRIAERDEASGVFIQVGPATTVNAPVRRTA